MRALIYTVWCIAYVVGVTYEVIKDQEGENIRCNSSTVISCKFSANVSILYWKIAPDVKNTSITAATCFGNSCSPHNLFSKKYLFTFDKLLSVSNVTINTVTIEHNNLEFWCNDQTTPEQIKLNVTEPPTIETTVLTNTTDELIIETQCVYPTDNINIKWFSKQINGSDRQQHMPSSSGHQLCNTSSECILANKSARITSELKLSTLTSINSSSQRTFEVDIIYGSGNYTFFVGNFFVPDIPIIKPKSEPMSGFPTKYIIIICVIVACCIAAIGVAIYLLRKRTNKAVDAPDTPTCFQQGTVAEESATFSCIPGLYRSGRQELVLSCHLVSEKVKHVVEKIEKIQQLKDDVPRRVLLMITNLRQGSAYDCFVYSRSTSSANRRSENSETIRIETLGLPNKPTHFKVLKVETNLIHLSWLPGEYRKDEQRFILEYTNMKTGDYSEAVIKMTKENQLTYTIEPLPAGTTYKVSLHAENNVGVSETVGPIEVTTQGNPDPPSEFRVVDSTHYSVTVIWKPGKYRRTTQTFIINYGKAKKNIQAIRWKQKQRDDDQKAVMTCTIDNLQPRTKYAFFLFAQNDIGVSLPTKIIRSKTEGENPENNVQKTTNENNKTNHLIDMINSNI